MRTTSLLWLVGTLGLGLACSASATDTDVDGGSDVDSSTGGGNDSSDGASVDNDDGLGDIDADSGTGGGGSTEWSLPAGFTQAELGGWHLGEELTGTSSGATDDCDNVIIGVVRDFKRGDNRTYNNVPNPPGHPDFEMYFGPNGPTKGMVAATLDASQKPTATGVAVGPKNGEGTTQLTSTASFAQWFVTDTQVAIDLIVNKAYKVSYSLQPNPLKPNVNTFQSDSYFPLDDAAHPTGAGFGDQGPFFVNDDNPCVAPLPADCNKAPQKNFHFTTEIHTKIKYSGGETFSFDGDDDLWVFVNNQLALDLGGLHEKATGSIDFDALGLTVGQEYNLDLFQAERGMTESHFRIDSTLEFTQCGEIVVK